MKTIRSLTIASALMFAAPSFAASSPYEANVLIDVVFLRPLGVVGIVAGSAAFIAVSPLTALATVPEPHDAFEKMANILIMQPTEFTFVRPVGVIDFNE